MDVSDLVRGLLRRWIAVLVVVVVALAAAAVGWSRTGQTRQTVAAVVIVPPKYGTDVVGQNPLLNLDNNLAQLATVLAQAMQSPSVTDALQRNGASGSFTVSTVTGTNPSFSQLSPQLQFTVAGTNEQQTLFTARTIVSQARIQLAALQDRAGVAASARAGLVESAQPTSADVVSGSRLRVAGSVGLGVLVLGLLAVLVIDTVLGRRSRRQPAEPLPAADPPPNERDEERDEQPAPVEQPPASTADIEPVVQELEVRAATREAADGPADVLLDLDLSQPLKQPATKAAAKTATRGPARKATAKRSAAKQAPATQAPAKQAGAKQAAAKQAPAKQATRTAATGAGGAARNGAAEGSTNGRANASANGATDAPTADHDPAGSDPLRTGR